MKNLTLVIEGLACPRCVRHLTESMGESGIKVTSADVDTGIVKVTCGDNADKATLNGIVEEAGYTLIDIKKDE